MKLFLSAMLVAASGLLSGCGTPSTGSSPADGPGTRSGNSGVEVFGTIDANVSGTRNK
ncbi:MAG: hypothetical protein ABW220_02620 [Burkholderiaceae bacterium]